MKEAVGLRKLFDEESRGVVLGIALLLVIAAAGSLLVEGFMSANNFRSILLLAAFLGIASLGQTLVALVGALDLSIPFVIGSANILLAFLFGTFLPPFLSILLIAALGLSIGLLNGILSYRIQGQSLILTLGVGFAVVGAAQIFTTYGSQYSGTVFSEVPKWFANLASINGSSFGMPVPPVVVVWFALGAATVYFTRRMRLGREILAVGGNRSAAALLSISQRKVWYLVHAISGLMAACGGMLLLGFSGGGFAGVGDPYLFTTVAAVVVGGTSLLGGAGGYGATMVGVLVLQTLTSLLVGLGFSFAGQQTIFGLLILPMVALYARAPHIRLQV